MKSEMYVRLIPMCFSGGGYGSGYGGGYGNYGGENIIDAFYNQSFQ